MRKVEFLSTLRQRLDGLPPDEIHDLMADYTMHFADGETAGRTEEEIAAALGDPMRLARELRAEAGFRRWETHRTPGNFSGALVGFLALIAVDFVLLLPIVLGFLMFTFIAGIVAVALCIAGLYLLMGQFGRGFFSMRTLHEILVGIALLGFGVGGGALLFLLADAVVQLLRNYARIHYTLLNQGGLAA